MSVPAKIGGRDVAIGAGLTAIYVVLLLLTSSELGMGRDEFAQ